MMFPRQKINAKSSFMWRKAVFLDCYILFSPNTHDIWDDCEKSLIFTDTTANECMHVCIKVTIATIGYNGMEMVFNGT